MRVALSACVVLALGGCHASEQAGEGPSNQAAIQDPGLASKRPAMHSQRFSNSAAPAVDEKGALGAARRLREYCELIASGNYDQAYLMWSDTGRASGLDLDDFRAALQVYRSFDCYLGTPGGMEGAAGSIYVEIPLKITGTLTKGGVFALEGPVTLRRINDVPGSTDEQRRWHIQSVALQEPAGL